MKKKKCAKCDFVYGYDNFCKKKDMPDGYSYYCRGCTSKSAKKYYDNNEEIRKKTIERNKKTQLQSRIFVMNYLLEHPCVDCGEARPECLDFDHQRDKIHNVSYLAAHGYNIKSVKEEISKCEVRCANCHRVKTAKQLGWYDWYPRLDSNQH